MHEAAVDALPQSIFAVLDALKARVRARGDDVIDLGIGSPDLPVDPRIRECIAAAYGCVQSHGYPPFRGTPEFLSAAAEYLRTRFCVTRDPDCEILALSGTEEGLAQVLFGVLPRGSRVLLPNIHYPIHGRGVLLAGHEAVFLPVTAESGFLPDLDRVMPDQLRGCSALIINYPHNPTGAAGSLGFFERAVEFCRRHSLLLISDLAYSEIWFGDTPAPSVLQVPGASDIAIEFHSMSKSFSMAGSRIGFVAGARNVISTLYRVRSTVCYGSPVPIQAGAAFALRNAAELTRKVRATYRARRDHAVPLLRDAGFEVMPPDGAMFLWVRTPKHASSKAWAESLLDRTGVAVVPGIAFGPGGEGYFRISLVVPEARLSNAVARLSGDQSLHGTRRLTSA